MTTENPTAQIHAQMTIDEILGLHPGKAQRVAQELTNAGLHCVGCGAATWETLEAGMLGHGKSQEQVEQMVIAINAILEMEDDLSTITLTPIAAKKFKEILEDEGKHGWGLRFDEKMAGCSGFEYTLDFSEKAAESDEVFESEGIQIHVRSEIMGRVLGSTIDYIEGLQNAGFKITNPNVRSACGCGSSHGY